MKTHREIRALVAMLAALLALCGAFAFADEADATLQERYEAAQKLFEEGAYEEAAEAFDALDGYEDSRSLAYSSRKKWKEATYKEALALYKEKKYAEAKPLFEVLGDFHESKHYLYTCTINALHSEYLRGKELMKAGEYEEAKQVLEALDNYDDSKKLVQEAEEMIRQQNWQAQQQATYAEALELQQEGKLYEARAKLIEAGEVEGATEALYAVIEQIGLMETYRKAEEAFDGENYAEALPLYQLLGDYEDSAEKAALAQERRSGEETEETEEEQKYRKAMFLRSCGKMDEANELFQELDEYRNAFALIAPRFEAVRLRDDATSPMSGPFTAPDGTKHSYRIYKGVTTWVEARAFCEALGGHLATLTTAEENDYVYAFMRESGYLTAYFGLSDEKRAGNWEWVTDEPFSFVNWRPGEPSYSPRERYGMYFYKHLDGTWNDSHFYEHAEVDPGCSFICEWDLSEETEAIYVK